MVGLTRKDFEKAAQALGAKKIDTFKVKNSLGQEIDHLSCLVWLSYSGEESLNLIRALGKDETKENIIFDRVIDHSIKNNIIQFPVSKVPTILSFVDEGWSSLSFRESNGYMPMTEFYIYLSAERKDTFSYLVTSMSLQDNLLNEVAGYNDPKKEVEEEVEIRVIHNSQYMSTGN